MCAATDSAFKNVSIEDAERDATDSGRFRIEQRLASGTFGATFSATDTTTGRSVVVRVLRPGGTYDRGWITMLRMQGLLHEAKALSELCHADIVAYEHAFHFEREGDLYVAVITGLCSEGNLNDVLITRNRHIDDETRGCMARQLASGLEFLHASGVKHRNLKPDNVLVDSAMNAKIAEFGLSKLAWDVKDLLTSKRIEALSAYMQRCSRPSAAFMAPEALDGVWSEEGDVFSLGLILAVMADPEKFQSRIDGRAVLIPLSTSGNHETLGRLFHFSPSHDGPATSLLGFSSHAAQNRGVSGVLLRLVDRMVVANNSRRVGISEVRFTLEQKGGGSVPSMMDSNEPWQMENPWTCCCFQ